LESELYSPKLSTAHLSEQWKVKLFTAWDIDAEKRKQLRAVFFKPEVEIQFIWIPR